MLATPEPFRPTQSPLGAVLLPQALIPRRTHSVAGGPFVHPDGLSLGPAGAGYGQPSFILAEPKTMG